MNDFGSTQAYWEFVSTVRSERRWIFDGKAANFIAAVRAAGKSRERPVKSGTRLCRAQVGSEFSTWPEDETGVEEEHPLPEQRMIPEPKYVKEGGRANPPGFAYLYLATNSETALAEMRPWVGESLTLGLFEVVKELKIVVCQPGAEDWGDGVFGDNPSAKELDSYVWNDIARGFACPVSREDQAIAYVPTQILAEAFKAEGFDGVAYRSSLAKGTNIVLFDVHAVKLLARYVYTLKKVRYDFNAAPNYQIYRRNKEGGGEHIMEIHTESAD